MDNDIRVAVILRDKKLRNDSADTLILGETIPEWNAVELRTVTPEHDVISFDDTDAENFEKIKKNMLIPQKEGESFDKKGNIIDIGQDIDLGLMIIKRGTERFTQPDLASYAKVLENNKTLLEPYVMHTNVDGNKWKNIPYMNDEVIYTINEEDIGIADDITTPFDKTLVHRLTVEVVVDGKVDYENHFDIKDGTLIDSNWSGFNHSYPGYRLKTVIDPFTMQYSMRYVLEYEPIYSPNNVLTNRENQFYNVTINWVMRVINYKATNGEPGQIEAGQYESRSIPAASGSSSINNIRNGSVLDTNILHTIPNVRIVNSNLPIVIDSNKVINIELEYTNPIVVRYWENVTFDYSVIRFSRDGGTSTEGLHIYEGNYKPDTTPKPQENPAANKIVDDRNYKYTVVNYIYNNRIVDSEEFTTFNTNTLNLHIPTGYSLGESPVISLGIANNVNVIRTILTNTLLFIDNVTGEVIHRQSFTGYTGDVIDKTKINMPFGYSIVSSDDIIIDSARNKRILVDNNVIPQIKIDPQRTLHRVTIKYMFGEKLIGTELVSIRGWRKPTITFPVGYKAKTTTYFDGWNPNHGEFIIEVLPKLQRINIEVRDKRNNIIIRNISKDVPYDSEFNSAWVTDIIKGFKIESTDYDHEVIHSSGSFTVYGELEQYWSVNVPFKENLTGDLKDDINMPEITFQKSDIIGNAKSKAKKLSIWKYPNQLSSSIEALFNIHNSGNILEINNLIKELRSDNATSLATVREMVVDKDLRVRINKVMKNDMFFNRLIDLNTFNKIDLFALDEYSYKSIEDYHVFDALDQISQFNERYLEYTLKFPFGYMISNIKEDNLYHSIMQDLVFYNEADDNTSVIRFDVNVYNTLIDKLNEYIDLVIDLKTNVATGYTSPHLNLHEDLIALANGRIIRDLQNVPTDINLTTVPDYIGMNAYGRLNANIARLRLAILSSDVHGLIVNRFKYRKSEIPNDHGLDPSHTWIYDDYGYLTWENATKLVQLIQDIYNLSGNLTITEGNKGRTDLIAIKELDVSAYNKTLINKIYDLFMHNMDNMVTTILSEEIRNHILENNAVNSIKFSWARLKNNLPLMMSKFLTTNIEKMTAAIFKTFVYPFFSLFELMYTIADNNHSYSAIFKDYSYYRNEAKMSNWLSKEDDLLIRNIMKDMSKLVTTFRKYYRGGGTNEFYKNVIEKVCHTPLSTKDIQSFNGIAGIDDIAKLNRSLEYRPAIYLDDIYPDNVPIKRLAWFGSKELTTNESFSYSYFINDSKFDNKYTTPSHTWNDLVIDYDTELDDKNVNWYTDPKTEVEVKKTRYLNLGERIYKLISHVLKNDAILLDRYINLINNFYSSVEDPIKYGWHKVHLKHINLDDRLIRTMGTFIDVHTKFQNVQSEIRKITDTTKPYIFSNTMSISDNASEYVNVKIQYQKDINNPKIKCSLFAIYDSNLHIAKVECNSDGIPIRVFTTVYGNRECKPVFIAPANADSTLVVKAGIDFTLNCDTAEVIASKINNADINKYDKLMILDTKYNGDIIINHTGETPTDKTILWGSNENKTIYSKFETVGEIDELASIPEFLDLTINYKIPSRDLKPGYNLNTRIERRNVIAKRRFWNENYTETLYAKLEGKDILKKQLINLAVLNDGNNIFTDNIVWEDIKVLTKGIPVEVYPNNLDKDEFIFTASFVDRNGQPIPETEGITRNATVRTTIEGKLNKKWVKRHPTEFRYTPKNGIFWAVGSTYYLEIVDGSDNVFTVDGIVNSTDVANGYIGYNHKGDLGQGDMIVTFIIQEDGKFRSIASIDQYEQLEVLPDEYFVVNNITLMVEDQLMNRSILNNIIDYEKSILGKVTIKGADLPLVLAPNIKIDIDSLAPFVRIKIHPVDNDSLVWEFSYSQDRLNYKYNYQKPIMLVHENNSKSIYDFIKYIGTYDRYDSRINNFYNLYPETFIAKPGKSYKLIVETCDFDGTELNTYEYIKTFTDNHINNTDSGKFLKNSSDNTYLPNMITYPDGNNKFIWIYNNIDKPLISDTAIFGITKDNGTIEELQNYDSLSNINGEYIDVDDMEKIEFGEYIKWTVDKNVGYPALENSEVYLRNERISPSVISASLEVSLDAKDKSEDDEADYFISTTFVHKYIKDTDTKIAVQLFTIKDGIEKKIGTKVVTYGEFIKTGYVSFGRVDVNSDNEITYKTAVHLIKDIQIGENTDTIEYIDSPRNKTEYTETFIRTASPFFDKKPDDIMVLPEGKIRIKKAIGVSYNVGSMGLIEIYDREHKLLVEKEFTINASDVNKGEVVFELDKKTPQIFTFNIYMQEPGKLPALPYITSAYLASWKIDEIPPKSVVKYVNVMLGLNEDGSKYVMSKFKITTKKFDYKPLEQTEIRWFEYLDKRVGYKTNISDDSTLEVVGFEEVPAQPGELPIIPFTTDVVLKSPINDHSVLSYYVDITDKYTILENLTWGYINMVDNPGDIQYDHSETVPIHSIAKNSKDIDGTTDIITFYRILDSYIGYGRFEQLQAELLYGYRVVNGEILPVSNTIVFRYNKYDTSVNFNTTLRKLFSLTKHDKNLNDKIEITYMSLDTDLLKEIVGADSNSFISYVAGFIPNHDNKNNMNWKLWENNLPVNGSNLRLLNVILPTNATTKAMIVSDQNILLSGFTNNIKFAPILKIYNNITHADASTYQNGYDVVTKTIHITYSYNGNKLSEEAKKAGYTGEEKATLTFRYRHYRNGIKTYCNLTDMLKKTGVFTSNGWYSMNSEVEVDCQTSGQIGSWPRYNHSGFDGFYTFRTERVADHIYAILPEKDYIDSTFESHLWKGGEWKPEAVNGIRIDWRIIPKIQNWESKAIVLNSNVSLTDLVNNKTYYGIAPSFRGHYNDELYALWKSLPTKLNVTLNCKINPFNIKFKYGENFATKTFNPTKTIPITVQVPHSTKINSEWLKYNLKFDTTNLSTNINHNIIGNGTVTVNLNYIGNYVTNNTPLIFPDTTSETDASNSISVTENDFISKTALTTPFVIKSPNVFTASDIKVESIYPSIPTYNKLSNDKQYTEFNQTYSENMTILANVTDLGRSVDANSIYSIRVNDSLYDTDNPIGRSYPLIRMNYNYKLRNKDSDNMKIDVRLSVWNAIKNITIKRASEIIWDVETMVNNKNLLKFDFKGTDINEIELYLYDVNKNKISVNYTHPVTDEDRTRGYKFIQVDPTFDLSNKVTLIYRSIAKDKGDIHFIPSKVKCETRTTQIKEEYNTKLKLRFRLKSIPNVIQYNRISGLVYNQYDYRNATDWNIFSASKPITINNNYYTAENDTDLKEYNLNIMNFSKISADNIVLPEGLKLFKDNWINESTQSKNLIVGGSNEVVIDVKMEIDPNDKYEFNEYIDLDFSGFGLKYDNNEIIRDVDTKPIYTRKFKAVPQDQWPVELRFFMYSDSETAKRFYALYVWVPYSELDTIRDYTFRKLVDNIDKYEYKLINQLYTDDNIYKPVSASTNYSGIFTNILPKAEDMEDLFDPKVDLKEFTIGTLKTIALNGSKLYDYFNFIVPDIQRFIINSSNNRNKTIVSPLFMTDSNRKLNLKDSLQFDKLKVAMTNYSRFIEFGEVADEENSRFKPIAIKNYKKFIIEYVNSYAAGSIADDDIISVDVALVDKTHLTESRRNEYDDRYRTSPWLHLNAIPSYIKNDDTYDNENMVTGPIINNVILTSNKDFKANYYRNSAIDTIFKNLMNNHTSDLLKLLVAFNPKLELLKSNINVKVLKRAYVNNHGRGGSVTDNPYQPIWRVSKNDTATSNVGNYINRISMYGYIYGQTEYIPSVAQAIRDGSKVIHLIYTIEVDSSVIEESARTGLRSAGRTDYSIEYLPNKTGKYNTIADGTGYGYTSLDTIKHKKLYEIPSVIDNTYLNKHINHYILHLNDITIDWEFISGEHEVMIQDLVNIHNIYNPTELGVNTKCNINVAKNDLNDKLKEIIKDYKGNSLSDFNMLDYIDNITYKDTDKVVPKISILNTNTIEPGEFTIKIKTNKYIPNLPSVFNRNNFFIKLDITTNFKYKYDIKDEDKEVLEKHINNVSAIFVVNKKDNSVYEFENTNDYEYNTSKSKLFILKSKKLDKMEMIAKEFDKKWLLSKINDSLSGKIDKLLKKSISPSLKRILNTIKSSSIPTYEWFINGYNTNNISNDNIILSTDTEIKGSKLINAVISNIDYNYTIKDNMYLSVIKPLNLTIDMDIIPSNSWKLNFIYNKNTFYSTTLLEEPSTEIIKNIWYSLNDNENLNIFTDNTINMYTNITDKSISVFAEDILEVHTLTLTFKSNMFSKEQRTFNITKYAHSNITEEEFWSIFQSSNIHDHFITNVPNIIKYYDFTYDTSVVINMNTRENKSLEDIPDIYYGVNVNIKLGNNIIKRTIYLPNGTTITYIDIYNKLIVPINIEHYLNDNIKRIYYIINNYDEKITINGMLDINIDTIATTELKNTNILFNSSSLPVRKTPIVYDIPIKSTDNVTRLLNSINIYDPDSNTFITNIGDTSIDIESKYATFFGLPSNNLNAYYSEPLKQVIRRLSLLDDSRLEQLSPRLNEVRRRAIIGNMPVAPSSINIIDTNDTTTKAIDVYNINITATHVNVYINVPAYYDVCYAVNYEPGDMLTVARVITDFNILNRVKLSFKRSSDINNSKILIAFFREDVPVVNPLIIDVANSNYTLAGNTINITNTNDINDIAKSLKIRGLIKMNDKTLPDIKPVKNSGLWLKQTSAIYDEYTDSEVQFIEDFYPLYHKTVTPSETIALVDKDTRIAYARTSSASCIVFRDGTEFYPIQNDISALKILSTKGVLKLY